MPPAGLEPEIPASQRPQTHALDRAAAGISKPLCSENFNFPLKGDHSVIYWYSCSELTSMYYAEDQRALLLSTVIIRRSNDLSVSS